MVKGRWCSAALMALGLVLAMSAMSTAAQLGDPASELKVAKWMKGGPVRLAEGKGKSIFVVEFWATWCPACRESIPHLTKVQRDFKDKGVVVVGVSAEDADTVKSFVGEMGSKMEYLVAADDQGATSKAYLWAFGIEGIPHAFVVDKEGRIAWHGHPMAGLGDVIEAILSGDYDIRTAQLYERTFELIVRYCGLAGESLSEDGRKGLSALGERIIALASKTENALFLNNFAWLILKDEEIEERDLELALRAAKTAYDICEGKSVLVLDTYAWALFENDRVAEAIEIEKRALELCEDESEKAKVSRTLQLFEQKARESG
jgi:peroxiredoxin